AAAALAVIGSAFIPRTMIRYGESAEFTGSTAGRSASVVLEFDADKISGGLVLSGEREFRLAGRIDDGEVRLAVSRFGRQESSEWVNYGELTGVLDLKQGLLDGTWRKNTSDAPSPIHFRQTASGKTLVRLAGVTLFDRGRTVEYRARLPAYLSSTPLD